MELFKPIADRLKNEHKLLLRVNMFKVALKLISSLFLLFSFFLIGFYIYMSVEKTDTFYIQNIQFRDFDYLNSLEKLLASNHDHTELREMFSVYVHRLEKGEGSVFADRWYSSGDSMVIDDEQYKKITIWVKRLPEKTPSTIDLSNHQLVRAVYSAGGSAWPKRGCSGYINQGSVVITSSGSSLAFRVKGKLTPKGNRYLNEACKKLIFDEEFVAKELTFSDLTPWLGHKGEHPYDETYP